MTNARRRGLTLIELLIALVFVSVTFLALAFAQLGNLRATARARILTDVKAAANAELEVRAATVLRSVRSDEPAWNGFPDQVEDSGVDVSFYFVDYAHACVGGNATHPRSPPSYRPVLCSGDPPGAWKDVGNGIEVRYVIRALQGSAIEREGVITVVVTARAGANGPQLTVGRTISCFDVYPTPTADTPVPCPDPA